jgi:hypothetical protein
MQSKFHSRLEKFWRLYSVADLFELSSKGLVKSFQDTIVFGSLAFFSCLVLFVSAASAQSVEPYYNQLLKYLHEEAKVNRDRAITWTYSESFDEPKLRTRIKQSDRLFIGLGNSTFAKNSDFQKALANIDELSRDDSFDPLKIGRLFGAAALNSINVSDSFRGSSFEMTKFEQRRTPTKSSCARLGKAVFENSSGPAAERMRESDGTGSLRLIKNIFNDSGVEFLVIPFEIEPFSDEQLAVASKLAEVSAGALPTSMGGWSGTPKAPSAESFLYREEANRFLLNTKRWRIALRQEGELFTPQYTNYANHGISLQGRNSVYFDFNGSSSSRPRNVPDHSSKLRLASEFGTKYPFRFDATYIWTTYQKLTRRSGRAVWSMYLQFRPNLNVDGAKSEPLCSELVLERRLDSRTKKELNSSSVDSRNVLAVRQERERVIDELFSKDALARLEWKTLTDPSLLFHRQLFRLKTKDEQIVVAKKEPLCLDNQGFSIQSEQEKDSNNCEFIHRLEFKAHFLSTHANHCFPLSNLIELIAKHGSINSDTFWSVLLQQSHPAMKQIRTSSEFGINQLQEIKSGLNGAKDFAYPDSTRLEIPSSYLGFQFDLFDGKTAKKTHRVSIKSFNKCVASVHIFQI